MHIDRAWVEITMKRCQIDMHTEVIDKNKDERILDCAPILPEGAILLLLLRAILSRNRLYVRVVSILRDDVILRKDGVSILRERVLSTLREGASYAGVIFKTVLRDGACLRTGDIYLT